MGNKILKMFSKKGKERLTPTPPRQTLHDIPAVDIDGNQLARLGEITEGKRCIMVVNVASM